MKPKSAALALIKSLPEQSTYEDIQYHLYVREKIERGLEAIKKGDVVSQQDAEKKVSQWLKSSGRRRR